MKLYETSLLSSVVPLACGSLGSAVGHQNVQATAARDQATLARRDHVMELFNRAVEQLGHDRLEVRLGAIYTLREIDRDFSDLCGPVFELLSTYVRERTKASSEETPQIDTAEIMDFLRKKLSSLKSGDQDVSFHSEP